MRRRFLTILLWGLIIFPTPFKASERYHDSASTARSIGLGGSVIAFPADPSASYWNPAAIAFLTADQILINVNRVSKLNYTGFTKYFPPSFGMGVSLLQPPGQTNMNHATIAMGYRYNSMIAFGSNLNLGKTDAGKTVSSFGFGFFFRTFPEYNPAIEVNNPVWRWLRSSEMKNKFTFGLVFQQIPVLNSKNEQQLAAGFSVKPWRIGPVIHFAYHLYRIDDSFHLGSHFNLYKNIELIAGLQDFDIRLAAAGMGVVFQDFCFDFSYSFHIQSFNFSLRLKLSQSDKEAAKRYRGKGVKQVRNNDFFGALKQYQKALAYDPEDESLNLLVAVLKERVDVRKYKIDSLFAVGKKMEDNRWYIDAFHAYRNALEFDPKNKNALKNIKKLKPHLDQYVNELFGRSKIAFENNNFAQAETILKKILSVNKLHQGANLYVSKIDSIRSSSFSEYFYRGVGYYNQKNYKRALQELNKALAVKPSDTEALRYKNLTLESIEFTKNEIERLTREAERLERGDNFVKANNRYRQILELEPDNRYAKEKLAYLKSYISKVVQSKFFKANHFFDQKEYQKAIGAFREILSIDPTHRASKDYLNRAQQLLTEQLDQRYQQALTYFEQKEYENSLEEINYILSVDNKYSLALSLQAQLMSNISLKNLASQGEKYFQKGDYINAQKIFSQILAKNPENKTALTYLRDSENKIKKRIEELFNEGMINYSEGDYNAAIQVWNRILKLDPYNSSTLEYIQKATERLRALDSIKEE